MLNQFPWSVALALLVTAPVVGKVFDAAFHRTYNPRLKERLFAWAVRFDELSYVQLIHRDTTRGLRLLERLFGTQRFSWRFALVSVVPPLTISAGWLLKAGTVSAEDVGLIIYLFVSVLIGQVSLLITKKLLSLAKPRLVRLATLLTVDVAAAYILGPLPFVLPYALFGDAKSLLDVAKLQLTYIVKAAGEPGIEPYLLWSMFLIAVLPTFVHMAFVIHDVIQKAFVRPLAKFAAGLFEFLSNEKQPITWTLGILGALPAILKAWSEVTK